jgi:hypothetical protein
MRRSLHVGEKFRGRIVTLGLRNPLPAEGRRREFRAELPGYDELRGVEEPSFSVVTLPCAVQDTRPVNPTWGKPAEAHVPDANLRALVGCID